LIILLQIQRRQAQPANEAAIIVFRAEISVSHVRRLRIRIEKLDFEDMIGDLPVLSSQLIQTNAARTGSSATPAFRSCILSRASPFSTGRRCWSFILIAPS